MFFPDNRKLKFITFCGHFHTVIFDIKEAERLNKGKKIIDDSDNFVKNAILEIEKIIEANHYTENDLIILNVRFPQIKFYYQTITNSINKFVKAGDEWLPTLVYLSLLQEFTQKGHKEFEHIPFIQLIDRFIVSKEANSSKFLKMVSTIYEDLLKAEFKRVKKHKIKRVKNKNR